MIFTRSVSLTNFLVATSALGFQVFVLYPWHKQLDDEFKDLKREHLRVLQAIENASEVGAAAAEKPKGIREMLRLPSSWRL